VFARVIKGIASWSRGSRRRKATDASTPRPRSRTEDPERVRSRTTGPPPADTASVDAGPDERDTLRGAVEERIGVQSDMLFAGYEERTGADDAIAVIRALSGARPGLIRQPPLAAQAVLSVLRRRNYSLDQVTDLIERDPALAQTLLRHANSAWYATPGAMPVEAIAPAVRRIGTSGVHSTVMSTIIGGEVSRPGPGFDRMAREVWDHMVRVAPIARRIGRALGADPEEAFTLGLAHDVGKLVFFDQIAELRRRQRREIRFPDGFLADALAALHEALGGLAALEWGLSARFARVIATHHRAPPPEPGDMLSEVVFLAERMDLAEIRGDDFDAAVVCAEGALTCDPEAIQAIALERAENADESTC
jgi:HD-like signal output (HDOD) protein